MSYGKLEKYVDDSEKCQNPADSLQLIDEKVWISKHE